MGTDGPGRPRERPGDARRAAPGTQRSRRMVRRAQAQLRGIVGAGQDRLREKLRGTEGILRQGEEGFLAGQQSRCSLPWIGMNREGEQGGGAMRKGFIVFSALMLVIAAADASAQLRSMRRS